MVKRTVLAVFVLLFSVMTSVLAAPGDVDTTFNAPNGYAVYEGVSSSANAIAVQADGKIVVLETVYDDEYNPDLNVGVSSSVPRLSLGRRQQDPCVMVPMVPSHTETGGVS